jgi:Rhodopirellula transposase DDE domain/Winged helix-turn helix
MVRYDVDTEKQMQRFYSSLNEKDRRRYAAIEAIKIGWGGISYVSKLFGCDYYTVKFGIQELDDDEAMNMDEVRRQGGGRKSALESIEGLDAAFLRVIKNHTAGSPMDENVKWTNLKRHEIAELLETEGIKVSVTVVDQLLEKHGYRRRKAQKRLSTGNNPQRNEQFENIEEVIQAHLDEGNPIISMDTKKKN